jgi:hypothetical protein
MNTEQQIGSIEKANTHAFKIGDAVFFLARKVSSHSIYMGIKCGVIVEFRQDRARVRYPNGRSTWVGVELLRPGASVQAMREILLRPEL